jgi:RND family efflux transporter MFP subunit
MKRKVAATALGLLVIAGCRRSTGPAAPPPTSVKVAVLRATAVPRTTEYVATLQSRQSVTIQPQVEGFITRIFVKSGDRVAAGAPLMEVDPRKQAATVHATEATHSAKVAALRLAEQQFQRASSLFSQGLASKQDLDQAQSALDSARADSESSEAQVKQESVNLGYYRVEALSAGVVGDIPVRVGDRVTNATVLTTLDKSGGLEAYISVPVEHAGDLKPGLAVDIVDDSGKVLAHSRIAFVAPRVSDDTQSVLAKAPIDDAGGALRPAELVRARVVWSSTPALTVPIVAVSRVSGQHFVFVVEGSEGNWVARQRPVKLGEMVGNDYVVESGLRAGDRVVTEGVQKIGDGAPVSPQS